MKVLLFGATGMVGQGVLRECLLDDRIDEVITIGRASAGQQHAKLREIVQPDIADLSAIEGDLAGIDACFFCLGISSAGMSEPDYRKITYDLTVGVARPLAAANSKLIFIYVSGQGTGGRMMWGRVKLETENALLEMPFQGYMMRPGFIQPLHGIKSKTSFYRIFYLVSAPLYPLLKRLFPRSVTSTERLGRAMIAVARQGAPKRVLESADINMAAGSA